MNPMYVNLLKNITEKIESGGFSTTKQSEKKNILRIGEFLMSKVKCLFRTYEIGKIFSEYGEFLMPKVKCLLRTYEIGTRKPAFVKTMICVLSRL